MIVSEFCFVLFYSSFPTTVGGKIHCSEPLSVNIHYDHLTDSYPQIDQNKTLYTNVNYSSLLVERSATLSGSGCLLVQ